MNYCDFLDKFPCLRPSPFLCRFTFKMVKWFGLNLEEVLVLRRRRVGPEGPRALLQLIIWTPVNSPHPEGRVTPPFFLDFIFLSIRFCGLSTIQSLLGDLSFNPYIF